MLLAVLTMLALHMSLWVLLLFWSCLWLPACMLACWPLGIAQANTSSWAKEAVSAHAPLRCFGLSYLGHRNCSRERPAVYGLYGVANRCRF